MLNDLSEQQKRFVELRARGGAIGEIASELHISLGELLRWEDELSEDIAAHREQLTSGDARGEGAKPPKSGEEEEETVPQEEPIYEELRRCLGCAVLFPADRDRCPVCAGARFVDYDSADAAQELKSQGIPHLPIRVRPVDGFPVCPACGKQLQYHTTPVLYCGNCRVWMHRDCSVHKTSSGRALCPECGGFISWHQEFVSYCPQCGPSSGSERYRAESARTRCGTCNAPLVIMPLKEMGGCAPLVVPLGVVSVVLILVGAGLSPFLKREMVERSIMIAWGVLVGFPLVMMLSSAILSDLGGLWSRRLPLTDAVKLAEMAPWRLLVSQYLYVFSRSIVILAVLALFLGVYAAGRACVELVSK